MLWSLLERWGREPPEKKWFGSMIGQLCRENGVCLPDDTGILVNQLDGKGLPVSIRVQHVKSGHLITIELSIRIGKSLFKFVCRNVDTYPGTKGRRAARSNFIVVAVADTNVEIHALAGRGAEARYGKTVRSAQVSFEGDRRRSLFCRTQPSRKGGDHRCDDEGYDKHQHDADDRRHGIFQYYSHIHVLKAPVIWGVEWPTDQIGLSIINLSFAILSTPLPRSGLKLAGSPGTAASGHPCSRGAMNRTSCAVVWGLQSHQWMTSVDRCFRLLPIPVSSC